ncbi:MAG: outer membrane homotrimeric porin [Pseudomonadota bacterium]
MGKTAKHSSNHWYGLSALRFIMTAFVVLLPACAGAMTFQTEAPGKMEISGSIKASFGMTQYLDWVDNHTKADDADFDATRELGLNAVWLLNDKLKGVVSFQIGEGSTGGYFGSNDALVGGEEDGDLIVELDKLYIDFTTDSKINFKIGSQGANLSEIAYGSHIMNEVPSGIAVSAPLSQTLDLELAWFRIADLMDDTNNNTDDQADLFWVKTPVDMGKISFTPWAAFATIEKNVIQNAASYSRYAYFNYPLFLTGSNISIADPMPVKDVTSYYLGTSMDLHPNDALSITGSITYGDMSWETASVDTSIAGFFADLVVSYKMKGVTPEFFTFYGSGPNANDNDLDMMPVLIGGPTYTSSYFGGSRFNDNMFDSYDSTYATSMWALGFKLKDIKMGTKLSHELQLMYAAGTADDSIFQSPDDILLNEDESVIEINFNSEYQIMDNLLFATELGYMIFDEDDDYNEALNGTVKDFWKTACAIELSF